MNERDGVLVLSENAGAYEELGGVGDRREPVRRVGPGAGAARGARDAAGERRRRADGHPRPGTRERPRALDRGLLSDLDRALRRNLPPWPLPLSASCAW